MRILKIIETKNKTDSKKRSYTAINTKSLYKGAEIYCWINSYVGPIESGSEIDDKLVQEKEWKGKPSYSVFLNPDKNKPQAFVPEKEPLSNIQTKQYVPEELENLMTKCLEYFGRQKELIESCGIPKESVAFIIGSLFNAMKERGIRPNDWMRKATESDFADPKENERIVMLNAIKQWLDEGKITGSEITATTKLQAKNETKLSEQPYDVVLAVYAVLNKKGLMEGTGFDPTPVDPSGF